MRWLSIVLFCINLYAIEYKSSMTYKYISYNDFENENMISGDLKLKHENEGLILNGTFEYLYSLEYDKKRYIDPNELYILKDFPSASLNFGKQIKYWGELEGFNVADIFNKKRYIYDPFDKDKKVGSYTLNTIFYLDDSNIEVGTKFYEEDMEYPGKDEPYYPFILNYNADLQSTKSRYTPSIYIKYGFTTEEIESENKLIFWHGFDSKRQIILDNSTLYQEAYISTKLIYLSNIIYEDYIFKFEGMGTDVESEYLSDYAQVAFGVEKSIYDIKGNDLTFYLEYYKYKYFNTSQKNIDISEAYNNDIFIAVKLNLNDANSSEFKGGILLDTQTSERVFKVEFFRRLNDRVVLNSEILSIEAKDNSVLTAFDNSTRVTVGFTYNF